MSELRVVILIWTLLLIMAVGAVVGARQRVGAAIVALASLVWLLVDTPFEGLVLLDLTSHNGLTTSDLVGVFGFALALWQFVRLRPGSRGGTSADSNRPCRAGGRRVVAVGGEVDAVAERFPNYPRAPAGWVSRWDRAGLPDRRRPPR